MSETQPVYGDSSENTNIGSPISDRNVGAPPTKTPPVDGGVPGPTTPAYATEVVNIDDDDS